MGIWFVAYAWHGQKQVSVHLLPTVVMLAGFIFCFVRGIAVLVFYGRHVEADHA